LWSRDVYVEHMTKRRS